MCPFTQRVILQETLRRQSNLAFRKAFVATVTKLSALLRYSNTQEFRPGLRGAETQFNDFHRNGAPRLKTPERDGTGCRCITCLNEDVLLHDPTLNSLC
jgi:hypothetical protein